MRHPLRRLLAGLVFVTTLQAAPARAAVVERVVAVIGEKAILLSDLRRRARPFLVRIHEELPPGARRAAAVSQLYRALLDRIVEEELQQRAASRARIAVTSREIDEAIARIAAQNRVTVERLVEEARASGMNERAYRDEVRRQVLEAKLLNQRLQGRIRVTEQEVRAAYRSLVAQERRKLGVELSWIVVDAPKRATAAEARAGTRTAASIAEQARRGADFAALARRHSADAATRSRGGALGRVAPSALPAPVERAVRALDVGEVTEPIRLGDRLVVVRVDARDESNLPPLEEAQAELSERVYLEKMTRARKTWLDGLRRRTHVEIRY
ncbi:MAG: peptidyl-prolyl cis-trans isomerase [Polyangiaceae bacterium]|nr:peptidyl-prolyl cis-trans isomerase [Polyangiaceae bacterium]